jgi:death-on-curing family protein
VPGGVVEQLPRREVAVVFGIGAVAVVEMPRLDRVAEQVPTFAEKAAALMHSLARNHPIVDGNKRLAWAGSRIFCLMNGSDLGFTVDEAEVLVLDVAAGNIEVGDLAATIAQHLTDVG